MTKRSENEVANKQNQNRSAVTAARILAGLEGLLQSGKTYETISLQQIADASLSSKSNLYYYFTCKEDVFSSLYKAKRDGFSRLLFEVISPGKNSNKPLREIIRNYLSALHKIYSENTSLLNGMFLFQQKDTVNYDYSSAIVQEKSGTEEVLEKYLDDRKECIFHHDPKPVLAMSIEASIKLLAHESLTEGYMLPSKHFNANAEKLLDYLADLTVNGIKLDEAKERIYLASSS